MKSISVPVIVLCGILSRGLQAQAPQPFSVGRLGIMGGMTYQKGGMYGAQLSGMYYLTPESRPLSFRVEGFAAWSPYQSIAVRAPVSLGLNYVSDISSGTSREIGGGFAAVLHARPKSRISPYLIAGYGLSERWQDGANQSYSPAGVLTGRTPWLHSYYSGAFSAGVGLRARVGGQVFRLEAISTKNRVAFQMGMSIPF